LLREWFYRKIARFLEQRVGRTERLYRNDAALLKRHISKGDVLLVEGDQRISAIIKYLTQSSWSHAALYIGDELLRRGGELRESALEQFGDEAEYLVVEALMEGVVVSPVAKYLEHNLRICRPHRLRAAHLRSILDESIHAIGWRYDMRNITDLARHLISATLMPSRYRSEGMVFGSGIPTAVICTSLIGRLFHHVGFPVLPSVTPAALALPSDPARRSWWRAPWRRSERPDAVYRRLDPSLLTPRDFDLSPYFEVVKFNVIKQRGFDYGRMEWDDTAVPPPPAEPSAASRFRLRGARAGRREGGES
jgi:Permuted papain-like amidase enzyme, YaeF/YiiX, C92 family